MHPENARHIRINHNPKILSTGRETIKSPLAATNNFCLRLYMGPFFKQSHWDLFTIFRNF